MSDEVSQFLEQVERLRGQQIEEDEVRARELEEYLAAKRERQARREERARSISPQKSSPANTPSPRSSRIGLHLSDASRLESPVATSFDAASREASAEPATDPGSAGDPDIMAFSSSPTKENESPVDAETKRSSVSASSTRASPLSWQRRPNSRGGSRPLSMLAAQNATQRSLAGSQEPPTPTSEQTLSRDQIAQALGSKDPSWFSQTAERGQGSAAYRKSQVDDDDRSDMATGRAQLPGMSAEPPKETAPSRSSISQTAQGRLASPLPLNPPRFDGTDDTPFRTSPTGRASPTRSPSPTKGMGGFVQSAMMKRSDSVKRWSVTSPPGLTRADSIASNRGAYDRNSSLVGPRPLSTARGASTTPGSSRPTSQTEERSDEPQTTPKATAADPTSETTRPPTQNDEDVGIPSSPSKTMDPRRWSPTKSSWLESALNKPESPKPQSKPQTPSQPAWKADMNKNKTGDRPATHKHQVSVGGLMRSSPMGQGAKPNTTGLGGIYSPPIGGNRPAFGHISNTSLSKSTISPEPSDIEEKTPPPESNPQELGESPEPLKRTSTATSPAVKPKPKPENPPKKDLRASLKARAPEPASKAQEPEFKNVFGNLRKTRTQNYVAPDELKDNILKGKAGLNLTGGPKKTERKDEFKDAILKKKDDFKKAQAEGKGITRSSTATADKPLPEGLARRAELGRAAVASKRDSASETKSGSQPKKADSPKPSPGPKRISSQSTSKPPAEAPSSAGSAESEGLKRVKTEPDSSTSDLRSLPVLQKETSAPSRLQQRSAGGGALAGRFNPALAGMLARGPPPMATNGGQSGTEDSGPRKASGDGGSSEPSAPGPHLTHMTKGRARGPRRKAPTAAAGPPPASEKATVADMSPSKAEPTKPKVAAKKQSLFEPAKPEQEMRATKELDSPADEEEPVRSKPQPANPAMASIQQQVAAKAALRGKPSPVSPPAKMPEQEKESELHKPKYQRGKPVSIEPDLPAKVPPQSPEDDMPPPSSPKKLDVKRMSRFLDETPANSAQPEIVKEPVRLAHQRTGSRSPVKTTERSLPEPTPMSPTKVDSEPVAPVRNATSRFGGAAVKSPSPGPKPTFDGSSPRIGTARTPLGGSSRPLPPAPTDGARSPPPVDSPARSPTKQASELSVLLNDFFGPQRPRTAYKVDAGELLANRPSAPAKIKSTGCQILQIAGDGKKLPVPAHYERVLFEREMYVCAHDFINDLGKKMLEVYFWVGDEVPESAAEDAQLFAQREARSLGGRLIKLRQGKETAGFLQALGGVVIIRRGSSNKYDSLAPNMLCGRRYLGQVAFDEVDFAPSSLCAGFPYLITQHGKCYLWKGKGSDVDELSGARLIGMDLSLTGELIECEDGSEPASFWGMFEGGGSKPHSAQHWRLKPNYSKYCSRLFCSDADSRQQIFEIHPFCQADLSPSGIYIIDAFFEMYVVVGSRAQPQYVSFRNALDFAQEYAILAAGMEDRPFVPVSTVVLEGVPRDLRSVFRKWTDGLSPTVMRPAAGLKRGRSLRVVPLTQALQALSE